jgi:hypothetical protein
MHIYQQPTHRRRRLRKLVRVQDNIVHLEAPIPDVHTNERIHDFVHPTLVVDMLAENIGSGQEFEENTYDLQCVAHSSVEVLTRSCQNRIIVVQVD